MAKRFTDTGKWDKGSFMDLSPKMKLAWDYLCDKCDHAGIWDVNVKLMSMQIGWDYTIDELIAGLGERIEMLSPSKMSLIGFVEFQYGDLNPNNRVHLSVIKRLETIQNTGLTKPLVEKNKPLVSPLQGAKDKDKEKDKEKDKVKEKEKEKEESVETKKSELNTYEIETLYTTWKEALTYHNIERDIFDWEKSQIVRQMQAKQFEPTYLALLGARYEPASEKFKPHEHCSLNRYFDAQKFARFVSLGAQARKKLKERESKQRQLEALQSEPELFVQEPSEEECNEGRERVRQFASFARKMPGGAA